MIQNITHSLIDVFDEVVFKKNIKKKKRNSTTVYPICMCKGTKVVCSSTSKQE